MSNWNEETLLEVVEMYASEAIGDYIDSEEDLSNRFDEQELESHIATLSGHEVTCFLDDEVMINEMFSNWKDSLCKNGDIHPIQYDQYCYVGQYS